MNIPPHTDPHTGAHTTRGSWPRGPCQPRGPPKPAPTSITVGPPRSGPAPPHTDPHTGAHTTRGSWPRGPCQPRGPPKPAPTSITVGPPRSGPAPLYVPVYVGPYARPSAAGRDRGAPSTERCVCARVCARVCAVRGLARCSRSGVRFVCQPAPHPGPPAPHRTRAPSRTSGPPQTGASARFRDHPTWTLPPPPSTPISPVSDLYAVCVCGLCMRSVYAVGCSLVRIPPHTGTAYRYRIRQPHTGTAYGERIRRAHTASAYNTGWACDGGDALSAMPDPEHHLTRDHQCDPVLGRVTRTEFDRHVAGARDGDHRNYPELISEIPHPGGVL